MVKPFLQQGQDCGPAASQPPSSHTCMTFQHHLWVRETPNTVFFFSTPWVREGVLLSGCFLFPESQMGRSREGLCLERCVHCFLFLSFYF